MSETTVVEREVLTVHTAQFPWGSCSLSDGAVREAGLIPVSWESTEPIETDASHPPINVRVLTHEEDGDGQGYWPLRVRPRDAGEVPADDTSWNFDLILGRRFTLQNPNARTLRVAREDFKEGLEPAFRHRVPDVMSQELQEQAARAETRANRVYMAAFVAGATLLGGATFVEGHVPGPIITTVFGVLGVATFVRFQTGRTRLTRLGEHVQSAYNERAPRLVTRMVRDIGSAYQLVPKDSRALPQGPMPNPFPRGEA